ncbi:hypothetical protein [Blastococcus mobilis]|uniref:Uncharacterized protein n=1 Tax=Blastococcus mobilis TaxID=1938746 RepID=A0A238VXN7_9ACTN|nr:hypothetical protein [Blastococcus mobilis]SNR38613.1 hypothetical protein SAMN06272737_105104 [Blastococcus mobilis]
MSSPVDMRARYVSHAAYAYQDRQNALRYMTGALRQLRPELDPETARVMTRLLEAGFPGCPEELWDTVAAIVAPALVPA